MEQLLIERIKCEECPIRHRAVCARCNDDELSLLEAMKTYRTFDAGAPILWSGSELRYVSSIVKGVATLNKTLEDGRTQLVGLMLPSDLIGRPGRATIDFDVIATTDVTLCCFDRERFEKLVNELPHLSNRLLEMAFDELDSARDWMLLLGRKTAREKIASFIELLVRRSTVQGIDGVRPALVLPLTRDQIGNFVGLTIETVSRQLTALKNDGILDFSDRRSFKILDYQALHKATGDDP